ncbi:MAG: outer membrane protein assembly factor BamD (BamD/ComL family) [Halioglobus sp.]|jgi:outer membrane protein assembly factor BamD (BamD/ComL family)
MDIVKMKALIGVSVFLFLSFVYSTHSHAQTEQQDFLNGKLFLNEGKFNFAMEAFKDLANPNAKHSFKEYASFYYALAAYKNNEYALARSMWLQMESKYPSWKQIPEVYNWLSELYYQENDPLKGTYYAKKAGLKNDSGVLNNHLSALEDFTVLKAIYEQYPDDKGIASVLAKAIVKQPLAEKDFKLIKTLSDNFDFSNSYFGLPDIGKSSKKEVYHVAVLLPFMFEGLVNTSRVERNKIIMDIYEGILQAAKELNAKNELIKIYPYDTRRDGVTTKKILGKPELKEMDLIIGPLYPDPSKLTSQFCFSNKINMMNPVSSNSAVINNNPYSFLFKSTYEVQALKAAKFTVDSLQTKKKTAYVFFDGNEKDSLMAQLYADKISSDGFEVIHKLRIDEEKIQNAYQLLTETYESMHTKEEADSIAEISGRLIKERKVKIDIENSKEKEDSLYLFEERFIIEWDSIGHIYLASSKPLHASMFISAIEIRGDGIPLIGRDDWLGYDMLTIDQMERLGVYFVSPDYTIQTSDTFNKFRSDYQRVYKEGPTINNMLGYELLMYTGQMMKKYGNYFQNGSLHEGLVEGKLFYGVDYKISNCNQVVPITQIIHSELELIYIDNDPKD